MTQLLSKTKVVVQETAQTTLEELSVLADTMGELQAQVSSFESDPAYITATKALAKTKALVSKLSIALPTTQVTEVVGKSYQLRISAASKTRAVTDNGKLFELLGAKPFISLAKVPLSAIDDYLTPEQKDMVLETTQSGRRTIKVSKV